MRKFAACALVVAVLGLLVSAARADDAMKVKREYYTPYGKVKIKEKVYPGYCQPYPYYYYGPGYSPYYYPPAPYGPYYYDPYCYSYPSYPVYGGPWPYYGRCKVEIDD